MKTLLIEGWRFFAHSYAMVGQQLALALSSGTGIEVLWRDLPLYDTAWTPSEELWPEPLASRLRSLPSPGSDARPDATLRCSAPFDLEPAPHGRTIVFATTEMGVVRDIMIKGGQAQRRLASCQSDVLTCSNWSREGFLRSWLPAKRLFTIPLGADPTIFRPNAEVERLAARRDLGWADHFVFLHLGAMTANKGVDLLVRAFGEIAGSHPSATLVLKGSDNLYESGKLVEAALGRLGARASRDVLSRITYLGATAPMAEIARLYQAADTYVSAYRAEGFNLPVLEAAACGTAVICTRGGPTDEFTDPSFAKRITSRLVVEPGAGRRELAPSVEHLTALMEEAIRDDGFRAGARLAGPAFVRSGWTWDHAATALRRLLGWA